MTNFNRLSSNIWMFVFAGCKSVREAPNLYGAIKKKQHVSNISIFRTFAVVDYILLLFTWRQRVPEAGVIGTGSSFRNIDKF